MTALAIAARREAGLLLDDLRALHNLDPKGLDDLLPVPGSDFHCVHNSQIPGHQTARSVRGYSGLYFSRLDCPNLWVHYILSGVDFSCLCLRQE